MFMDFSSGQGQGLYFDILKLAPLFNPSFDPNIKIKDLTPMLLMTAQALILQRKYYGFRTKKSTRPNAENF